MTAFSKAKLRLYVYATILLPGCISLRGNHMTAVDCDGNKNLTQHAVEMTKHW